MWAGLLPMDWFTGIASFGVCSFLSAVVLWKPLLKMQRKDGPHKETSSDFIGYEFRLDAPITVSNPGKTRYSGIEWRVEIDDGAGTDSIDAGQKVVVTSLDAGVFRVKTST